MAGNKVPTFEQVDKHIQNADLVRLSGRRVARDALTPDAREAWRPRRLGRRGRKAAWSPRLNFFSRRFADAPTFFAR
ncbi:MAG TPA: hypothetical protein VF588_22410 [Pyrinomonadaceae bacterium]|jgi:hypothetical protein